MAESASISKMSIRHEQILNFLIANPTAKYSEVAAMFSVTPAWLSTIIHSHAFQDQLQRRQNELFDVAIVQELQEKVQAAAHMTIDRYLEKIDVLSADQLISSGDKLLGRLGFGSKPAQATINANNVQINNHVAPEVLAEARSRIGSYKMGETDSEATLPRAVPSEGAEVEGCPVRAEGT